MFYSLGQLLLQEKLRELDRQRQCAEDDKKKLQERLDYHERLRSVHQAYQAGLASAARQPVHFQQAAPAAGSAVHPVYYSCFAAPPMPHVSALDVGFGSSLFL